MSAGDPDVRRLQKTESAIARWRGGDRNGLDEICASYHAGLQVFLRLLHRRLNLALRRQIGVDDVIQETWKRACGSLHAFEYRGADSFRRWIWDLALNEFRDQRTYWRAQRRDPGRLAANHDRASASREDDVARLPGRDRSPSSQARISEELRKMIDVLAQLPKREQTIVLLAEFHDESWKEIAAAVKAKSADAVRKEYQLKILPRIEALRAKTRSERVRLP